MRITLDSTEITKAITVYVNNMGFDTTNKTVDVHFTALRKDKGAVAEVDILDASAETVSTIKPVPESKKETKVETPKKRELPDDASLFSR